MTAIETLISVLCGPEGKCCISGSDDDRHLIDSALAELAQATAAQAGAPANMRLCYSCGHPADAHPWVNGPRGGKRRGDCPAAPAQPAAPQGVACAEQIPCGPKAILYAPLPDPAIRHEGGGYYNIYQLELFADATHALRAPHGQAPAGAGEPTEQQILEAAFAPAQPAVEASRFGSPELQAMIIARCVEKDQADSVQEYAALWHWLAEYLVGTRTDLDDEIAACETVNDLRKLVEAARKQGATHDR